MVEATLADFQLRLSELEQEKQAVEESLNTHLAQVKERLLSEQSAVEKQGLNFTRQLEAARNQISTFYGVCFVWNQVSVYSCIGAGKDRARPRAANERRGT